MAIKKEEAVVKLNSETIMSTSCITRSNVMNTKNYKKVKHGTFIGGTFRKSS